MKKRVVKLNPHKADGVTRRGRGTRAGDKWDRIAKQLWQRLENDIRTDAPKIAVALRRTNAAAYKRGHEDCHSFHEKNSQERR